jgi:NTP pyrophosphatase (non-canonical NTP hydrolase)
MKIQDPIQEILVIAQEEAAEVIQEISKCQRFGMEEPHRDGMLHRERLAQEVGDLMCMIDLMMDRGIIDAGQVDLARQKKQDKLKIYSRIYQ